MALIQQLRTERDSTFGRRRYADERVPLPSTAVGVPPPEIDDVLAGQQACFRAFPRVGFAASTDSPTLVTSAAVNL
jgi:hypothetical protein